MSAILKPLFNWYGGKSKPQVRDWVLSQLPPHRKYVEVFAGSAAVLLAKVPAEMEVYNDLDEALCDFQSTTHHLASNTLLPRWGLAKNR